MVVLNSRGHGTRKGCCRPVEVEAGHLRELRRVVELGVRLAREHRDLVAELGELAGEVPGVDALAAAVRVAPVDEPGDAEGFGGCHESDSLADVP